MIYNDFEHLPIWRDAITIAKDIGILTNQGHFTRDYGLRDQIRRAAASIASNIAEGFERSGNKEFIRFLYYAKGSASEVRTQLLIAHHLNYLTKEQYESLRERSKTLAESIGRFIVYLKNHLEKNTQCEMRNAKY